ncbi:hypothetical protein [Nocardiopsis ganjiahuensis]|uniref:hypothetical protein n=1 Tax=Nocardiopsis ganjiahuensis TaxID=239984 RepID=UPI00036C257D|nr:hypothetical protein [Nocardiopsis ganjiahuensis]
MSSSRGAAVALAQHGSDGVLERSPEPELGYGAAFPGGAVPGGVFPGVGLAQGREQNGEVLLGVPVLAAQGVFGGQGLVLGEQGGGAFRPAVGAVGVHPAVGPEGGQPVVQDPAGEGSPDGERLVLGACPDAGTGVRGAGAEPVGDLADGGAVDGVSVVRRPGSGDGAGG